MAEPTENNLSTLYLPSIASTQPTEEEVAAENQRRRELDIEYGLTGGEYSSALANSQGRPLSDKDLAFHLEMLSRDQSVAGTDQEIRTLQDYIQDIGNFLQPIPAVLDLQKKADGGELDALNKNYSVGPFGIDPEWLKSEFSYLQDIADFVSDNSQGVADDLTKEGGLFGDTTFERELANRRTDTPSLDPEKYNITTPEMSASNPDDRSIFSNLKGGGIEAVLLDKYPELADNPAFNLTQMIVPRSLGESAFELATMYPPLFWMKALKPGSSAFRLANKHQRAIDRLSQKRAEGDLSDSLMRRNKKSSEYHQSRINQYVDNNGTHTDEQLQEAMNLPSSSDPSIGPHRKRYLEMVERMADNRKSVEAGTGDFLGPNEATKLSDNAKQIPDNVIPFPKKKEGIESLDNGGFFPKGGFDFPNIRGGTDKIGVIDPMDANRKEYRKYLKTIKDDPRYASRDADVHMRSREEVLMDSPGHREDIANMNRIFEGETTEEVLRSPSRVGDPDVDAMEKFYRGSESPPKNPNALVDQSSTLKKGPESELMPAGYKTDNEIVDNYNDQFSSVLDDLMSPKAPKKTNTDDLSIFELFERIKDIDPD